MNRMQRAVRASISHLMRCPVCLCKASTFSFDGSGYDSFHRHDLSESPPAGSNPVHAGTENKL
jgi:hypothetical protein